MLLLWQNDFQRIHDFPRCREKLDARLPALENWETKLCLAYPEKGVVITVMSLEGDFGRIGNYLWESVVAGI